MGKVIFFLFSDGPNGPICSRCLLQHFPFHLVAKPAANSNLRPTLGSNPFRGILELHQIIEFTKKWVGNHSTLDINQNKHEQKICHYIYIYIYIKAIQIMSADCFPWTLVLFNCFPSLTSTLPIPLGAQAHSTRSLKPRRTRDKPSKLPWGPS